MIFPHVFAASGAIIGAHAVVAADVPPYAVVVGNPGRAVRLRYDEATIERLLGVSWWDWPIEKISRNLKAIWGADIDALEQAALETEPGLDGTSKAS